MRKETAAAATSRTDKKLFTRTSRKEWGWKNKFLPVSRAEAQKNVDALCDQLNHSGTNACDNFTASAVGVGSGEVFGRRARVRKVDLGWSEASGKI